MQGLLVVECRSWSSLPDCITLRARFHSLLKRHIKIFQTYRALIIVSLYDTNDARKIWTRHHVRMSAQISARRLVTEGMEHLREKLTRDAWCATRRPRKLPPLLWQDLCLGSVLQSQREWRCSSTAQTPTPVSALCVKCSWASSAGRAQDQQLLRDLE